MKYQAYYRPKNLKVRVLKCTTALVGRAVRITFFQFQPPILHAHILRCAPFRHICYVAHAGGNETLYVKTVKWSTPKHKKH